MEAASNCVLSTVGNFITRTSNIPFGSYVSQAFGLVGAIFKDHLHSAKDEINVQVVLTIIVSTTVKPLSISRWASPVLQTRKKSEDGALATSLLGLMARKLTTPYVVAGSFALTHCLPWLMHFESAWTGPDLIKLI